LLKYQRKPGNSKVRLPLAKGVSEQSSFPESPRLVSEREKGYIAGLLDVDSSFLVYKLSGRPSYLLEVVYRKTDYEPLRYLAGIYGGRIRPAPKSEKNIRPIWLWKISSQKAYRLLRDVSPFLRIKTRAAEICMEFFESYWRGRYGVAVSAERQAIGAKYAALLKLYQTKSMPHAKKASATAPTEIDYRRATLVSEKDSRTVEMEKAAVEAENDLASLNQVAVEQVAAWWRKWHMKVGHKRLGRVLAGRGV